MRRTFILAAAILALGIAGCGPAQKVTVIRIGLPGQPAKGPGLPSGLFEIAEAKGFLREEFGKEPVSLAYLHVAGNGVALNEALATGQLDFATYGGLPNVIGLAGGNTAKIVFVARSTGTFYLAVKPNSPIRSIQDLKGRKITVQKGNISHQLLVMWLAAHGLGETDVELVSLAIPDGLAAFAAGQVDAVWGTQTMLKMEENGQARIVGDTADGRGDFSGVTLAGTAVSEAFHEAHPDLERRLVKVMVKSAWWASQPQNRAEALRLQAEGEGFPVRYMERAYPGALKPRFDPRLDEPVRRGYAQTIAFAYDHKLIRAKPSLSGWLAPDDVEAALHDLHLEHYWDEATKVPDCVQ